MRKTIKSYALLRMHINKMMIIKVATDTTIAIITTTFLSSSGGFRLNGLSESLLVSFVEVKERFFDAIVEGKEPFLVKIIVVTGAFGVVVLVVVMVLTDVPGFCVVGANRVIGS